MYNKNELKQRQRDRDREKKNVCPGSAVVASASAVCGSLLLYYVKQRMKIITSCLFAVAQVRYMPRPFKKDNNSALALQTPLERGKVLCQLLRRFNKQTNKLLCHSSDSVFVWVQGVCVCVGCECVCFCKYLLGILVSNQCCEIDGIPE